MHRLHRIWMSEKRNTLWRFAPQFYPISNKTQSSRRFGRVHTCFRHPIWSLWPNVVEISCIDEKIRSRVPFCTPISNINSFHNSGLNFDEFNEWMIENVHLDAWKYSCEEFFVVPRVWAIVHELDFYLRGARRSNYVTYRHSYRPIVTSWWRYLT